MGEPCPAHFFIPTAMLPAEISPASGPLAGLIYIDSAIQPTNDAYQFPLGFYLTTDYARSLGHMFVLHTRCAARRRLKLFVPFAALPPRLALAARDDFTQVLVEDEFAFFPSALLLAFLAGAELVFFLFFLYPLEFYRRD